jgi:hypothetical protein
MFALCLYTKKEELPIHKSNGDPPSVQLLPGDKLWQQDDTLKELNNKCTNSRNGETICTNMFNVEKSEKNILPLLIHKMFNLNYYLKFIVISLVNIVNESQSEQQTKLYSIWCGIKNKKNDLL